MGPCVIQGFIMEPIPPDAALAIDSPIITCMRRTATSINQAKCTCEMIPHLILPTCYDNIRQIASINETSMSSTCQLPSSTI